MPDPINIIMNESIRFELLVSDLYLMFQKYFPVDADFWWTLALEEKNHAALIESLQRSFSDPEDLPHDLFIRHIKILEESNARLKTLIETSRAQSPSREDALRMALEIEESSVESRYQEMMSEQYPNVLMSMIQDLNQNDKDHAERIRAYMDKQDFPY